MKKILNRTVPFFMIFFCVVLLIAQKGFTIDQKLLEDDYPSLFLSPHQPGYSGPLTDDVRIAYSGAFMPIGHFLLIRRENEVCALKFTKFWNETKGEEIERNAAYISYYQNDGSANFLSQNVKITEEHASSLPARYFTRLFIWHPGTIYVKCGPFKLAWEYYGFVCACEKRHPGDYGFEYAPTPWENINEVNVFDKRIKWYRFDKKRKNIDIPIDKLWEEPGKKEEDKVK